MIEVFGYWVGVSVFSYYYLLTCVTLLGVVIGFAVKDITEDEDMFKDFINKWMETITLEKWFGRSLSILNFIAGILALGFSSLIYFLSNSDNPITYVDQISFLASCLDLLFGVGFILLFGYFGLVKAGNKIYKMGQRVKELEEKVG